MSLTDTRIRNAKAKDKSYKLTDARGLSIEITPKGSKRWRYRYYFQRKEKMLSFGLYPEVSLQLARQKQFEAQKLLAQGINPSEHRKAKKRSEDTSYTFKTVAKQWHEKFKSDWTMQYTHQVWRQLENHIFPYLGNQDIAQITPSILLKHLLKLEEKGYREAAHRTKGVLSLIHISEPTRPY